jgi:hypothetical protein
LYFRKASGGFKTDCARSLHEVQAFAIVHKNVSWMGAVVASAILGFVDVDSSFVETRSQSPNHGFLNRIASFRQENLGRQTELRSRPRHSLSVVARGRGHRDSRLRLRLRPHQNMKSASNFELRYRRNSFILEPHVGPKAAR